MGKAEKFQRVRRKHSRSDGRELSFFGGCDYFRLASHPKVLRAVREGAACYGLNVAASRVTTGNHPLYLELEKQLARFFGSPAALLTTDGYAANLIVAQALAGRFSHALIDERAHVSLLDAVQFLNCPVLTFKHRDAHDFYRVLQRCGPGARPIVLTDGMFSHDGSVAPLRTYLKLLPRDGLLLVDDAHGAGTLGRQGRGTVELEQVSRGRVVQTITLSKAFGVYGGAVICSRVLRKKLVATRMFIGSTPLPLPLAYAALRAVEIMRRNGKQFRERLSRNARRVKNALRKAGVDLPDAPGPIVSLDLKHAKQIAQLHRDLLKAGILPPFIKYPGGPASGYFRFVISSEHSAKQLTDLVCVLM